MSMCQAHTVHMPCTYHRIRVDDKMRKTNSQYNTATRGCALPYCTPPAPARPRQPPLALADSRRAPRYELVQLYMYV